MMETPFCNLAKQRKEQAMVLSKEARGERLDLGKKISTPRDVQMEELNLQSNRGSRMFLERQKRVEKFTLENTANAAGINQEPDLSQTEGQPGEKENVRSGFSVRQPGKHSLTSPPWQKTAKKGSPSSLAPGYSGPLKEIPREKFNVTVIPKSYCSPWREALGNSEELLDTLNSQFPEAPQKLQPANYRCFNRAPVPFGGSKGILPLRALELLEAQPEANQTWERMSKRPNFNRAPRGWGTRYSPESNEL